MRHVMALCTALVLNAAANLLMKIGMKSVQAHGGLMEEGIVGAAGRVLGNMTLVTGLACFALNALFYMYALQSERLPISIAYPLMVGGGYAVIALVAHWYPGLRESLNAGQWLGVGLILAGVMLVAANTRQSVQTP